jgi:hypothetical protein
MKPMHFESGMYRQGPNCLSVMEKTYIFQMYSKFSLANERIWPLVYAKMKCPVSLTLTEKLP